MKKYLSLEYIYFFTSVKDYEIIARLQNTVEPEGLLKSGFIRTRAAKPYKGEIVGNTFKIQRIINYRNSFLPVIVGEVLPDRGGTRINIQMRLNILISAFVAAWFLFFSIGFLVLCMLFLVEPEFDPINLMSTFGLVLFTAVFIAFFKYESIKAKKFLQELFEAEIIDKEGYHKQ